MLLTPREIASGPTSGRPLNEIPDSRSGNRRGSRSTFAVSRGNRPGDQSRSRARSATMRATNILLAALGGVVVLVFIGAFINGARVAREHRQAREPAINFEPVANYNAEPRPRRTTPPPQIGQSRWPNTWNSRPACPTPPPSRSSASKVQNRAGTESPASPPSCTQWSTRLQPSASLDTTMKPTDVQCGWTHLQPRAIRPDGVIVLESCPDPLALRRETHPRVPGLASSRRGGQPSVPEHPSKLRARSGRRPFQTESLPCRRGSV